MVKSVVQRKQSTPVAQDNLDRDLAVFAARKQFMSAAMNMGWQLAFMILVPVVVGVKLDDHFRTAPSYTLGALVLAIGGAVWIVGSTIKQVNREQADANKETKGGK
ncbi:MAG TPA: AtpZ/AtpI family protein [Candidatus Saccharimonadales bacterium]|nr:AtpZ/AtpI family protein [Candidatus Saccharimonadales bacterium]